MTEDKEYERMMELVSKISDICDGEDYFDMLYALTLLLSELFVEIESETGKDPGPMFTKMFNELLTEARDNRRLIDMDESNETAH